MGAPPATSLTSRPVAATVSVIADEPLGATSSVFAGGGHAYRRACAAGGRVGESSPLLRKHRASGACTYGRQLNEVTVVGGERPVRASVRRGSSSGVFLSAGSAIAAGSSLPAINVSTGRGVSCPLEGVPVRGTSYGHDRTCLFSVRRRAVRDTIEVDPQSPIQSFSPLANQIAERLAAKTGGLPATHLLGDLLQLKPIRDSPWRAHRGAAFRGDDSSTITHA